MNVSQLTIRRFPAQAGKTFDFPRRGIVLVTGANGRGKSALAEAVAWCAWGKTLRGTSLPDASVRMVTDAAVVDRLGARLKWSLPGEDATDYATKTKASTALESVIGDFSVWSRAAVFSSNDNQSFSRATDAERKRILEELGGLDSFDRALRACREDRKSSDTRAQLYENDLAMALAHVAAADQRIADQQQARQAVGGRPIGEVEAALRIAEKQVQEANAAAVEAQRAHNDSSAAVTAADHRVKVAHYNLQCVQAGVCSACGQEVGEGSAAKLRFLAQIADTAYERAQSRHDDLTGAYTRAYNAASAAQQAVNALQIELGQARVQERARAQCDTVIAEASEQRRVWAAREEEARLLHAAESTELAHLRACEDVLGLKGARTRVLARLLGALEAATNHYLAQLAPPSLRIELRPYTENKGGGTRGAISLLVHGIGEHSEYRAASSGQQRRVDLANMLALADLAAAQRPVGTMFFDEVFDALDADGVAAATGLLRQLSQDRVVVVITHSPTLIHGLPTPASHLKL